jgi:hypothetical protein
MGWSVSEMLKGKLKLIFFQLAWVVIIACAIHKILPLIWEKGEFVGLSMEQMLGWVFGFRSTLYFLVIFLFPLATSVYFLIRLKSAIINILWSVLVSWYITMFIYPGYNSNYFDLFGSWSDVIEYCVLIVLPSAALYLIRKRKQQMGSE